MHNCAGTCSATTDWMLGSHRVTLNWKSRIVVLRSTPFRYSETQMPMAYCPGAVGMPVMTPVTGSMLMAGSDVMG